MDGSVGIDLAGWDVARFVQRLRRAALITVGVLSPIAAVFAVHQLVTPERIPLVGTMTLLLMLNLLVLPTATVMAIRYDRKTGRRTGPTGNDHEASSARGDAMAQARGLDPRLLPDRTSRDGIGRDGIGQAA